MRTELLPRMVSFSFSAGNFSFPVTRFTVTLHRILGDDQRFCKVYADDREKVRVYEKMLPDTSPPEYTPRNESKIFIQDFFDLEELSSYRATFTAELRAIGSQVNRTTIIYFNTPGDGKIQ